MSEMVESAFKALPPLPDVAMRLLRAVNDVRVGANAIVAILRTDAALTSEVLRRANSPVYGLTTRVSSASQAVMLLGTDEVRRVATSISFEQRFGGARRAMRRLWRHAFARALVAERLACAAAISPEAAYTAGLLADIGVYGLLVSFADIELRVVEQAASSEAMLEEEAREFGMNHCEAGGWLASQWHFPETIVAAIAAHHDPPVTASLAALVFWADVAATDVSFGFLGKAQIEADLKGYRQLRQSVPVAALALPEEAEELFDWLVARVPA